MRNLPTTFHEEDVELGLSSSAPNMLNLGEMTGDEDDPGVEYQRMDDEDEHWRSEEWMENRSGLIDDGGIDWDSYREAMDLGGKVLNKDTSTSFDKFILLTGNSKSQYQMPNGTLEDKPKDTKTENSVWDKMCHKGQECKNVKNEKMVNHDQHKLIQEICNCRNRKPDVSMETAL